MGNVSSTITMDRENQNRSFDPSCWERREALASTRLGKEDGGRTQIRTGALATIAGVLISFCHVCTNIILSCADLIRPCAQKPAYAQGTGTGYLALAWRLPGAWVLTRQRSVSPAGAGPARNPHPPTIWAHHGRSSSLGPRSSRYLESSAGVLGALSTWSRRDGRLLRSRQVAKTCPRRPH